MNCIVISDIHIGGDTKLDIFRSQTQLAGFLKSLNKEPLRLVINGDFIDFLAVEPFGSFSRDAAKEKIKKIVEAPPNVDVWDAFQAFLSASGHQNRIDILLGNHDVELVFEEVQTALTIAMAQPEDRDRIRFLTDRLSHPKLVIGDVHFHIEHGFQYDPFNWYDHNKLIQATQFKQDGSKFELPVGSDIVYAVLNRLTPQHPYMPFLKPEAAAFWMLAALAPKEIFKHGGRALVIGSGTVKAVLKRFLRGVQLGSAPDPIKELTPVQLQLAEMLDKDLTDDIVEDLEEFLDHGTGDEKPSTGVTFASSPVLRGKLFFVRRALNSLKYKRDSFFDPTKRDEFKSALDSILEQGAKVAIFGHSHGQKILSLFKEEHDWSADPLLQKAPSILYLNTGTWANLLDFDLAVLANDEAAQKWLDNLEAGTVEATLIYTYARLEELNSGQGVRVSLEQWRDGEPHVVNSLEVSP